MVQQNLSRGPDHKYVKLWKCLGDFYWRSKYYAQSPIYLPFHDFSNALLVNKHMGEDIFRHEVMTDKGQSALGRITLAQPASFKLLTVASVVIALGVMAYFTWGSYTRKVQVSGVLMPTQGLTKIASPQGGVISAMKVTEGQAVRQSDVLFEISAQRTTEDALAGSVEKQTGAQLLVKQNSLKTELSQQRLLLSEQARGLERRANSLQAELGQIDAELATQQNRVKLSQQNLQRHESLVEQNFISPAQLLQHQTDKLEQQSRLQQLERNRMGTARELANVQAELKQMPLRMQAQLNTIDRSLAGLMQEQAENSARSAVAVLAQQDGVVTGLTVAQGATVAAGASLGSLIPKDTALQAHLFAPSQAIGFIEPGQKVMLRYAAYPYQKFGHQSGTVAFVSKTSMSPSEAMGPLGSGAGGTSGGNTPSGEALYRITVHLDSTSITAYGKQQPLSPGMSLEASVMQERRYLWEWVLEPLYSISGKV
jgi:membrane fusion protein